jgi:hypothetical protein
VAAGKGQFLCGGVFSPQLQDVYLTHRSELRPVDYYPKSQEHFPAEDRDRYEAFERSEVLSGTVEGRAVRLAYRTIFVWSQAKARQEASTRERHLGKVREAVEAVQRNLNRYSLKTRETIVRRLEQAKGQYVEGKLIEYELTEPRQGRFHLTWKTDESALEQW